MKLVRFDVYLFHLLISHFDFERILLFIELRPHFKTGLGGGLPNEFHNNLMADKRPSTPVHADVRKKAVLDFIPFT